MLIGFDFGGDIKVLNKIKDLKFLEKLKEKVIDLQKLSSRAVNKFGKKPSLK
jgi:hypothetical protein